ncbi:MAG: methylmalonyl-CoA mutase family protein [Spirosomataceae bacterium]
MLQLSEFVHKTQKDWISQATSDLKGENPMDALTWLSEEKMHWKPIYTSEDVEKIPLESIRIAQKKKNNTSFYLLESVYVVDTNGETIKQANQKALDLLAKGATSLVFDIHSLTLDTLQIQRLLLGIKTSETPIFWNTEQAILIYQNQKKSSPHHLKGGILEPIVQFTSEATWESNHKKISQLLLQTQQDKNFKVIWASSVPFVNAGANAVQELSYFCNQWVELLEKCLEAGHTVQEIIDKTFFEIGLTTNYFLDIAKIRAFRYLLHKLITAFEPTCNLGNSQLSGRLATYYLSPFSSHTNMLRATTATMSGLIGGLDTVSIPAWDTVEKPNQESELARRVALNTFHVVQEEGLLTATQDPSEGSYFLENLTYELIQQSWDLFLENEKKGGFWDLFKSGEVQTSIADMHEYRVTQKNKVMVGVNKYMDTKEEANIKLSKKLTFLDERSLAVSLKENVHS